MIYKLLTNSLFIALLSSFVSTFFGLKYFIKLMNKYNEFQPIRKEGPKTHLVKNKTPTMGGIIITFSILINILFICNLNMPYVKAAIFLILWFAFIGLLDDVIKVFFKNTKGFMGSKKLVLQLLGSGLVALYISYYNGSYLTSGISIPLTNYELNFGIFMAALYMILITGSSNATNMTDGLDGLLSIPVIFISITMVFISMFLFDKINNFVLIYNILIILASVVGSFTAFFIYNKHPAKIFMGDVASLMIGSLLCYIAILLKIEILYGIMALLFIFEIMSTVSQVFYFKITKGKRLFKMAPLHHHFEQCGFSENKVVIMFWLFSLICCILSLSLL